MRRMRIRYHHRIIVLKSRGEFVPLIPQYPILFLKTPDAQTVTYDARNGNGGRERDTGSEHEKRDECERTLELPPKERESNDGGILKREYDERYADKEAEKE